MLLFSGCALGPDYTPPEVDLPETFREESAASPEQITNINWWDHYQDENLKDLIKRALENNQDLATAVAKREEARAILGITRADFFPDIGLAGSATKQEFETVRPGQIEEIYTLSTPLFWELDLWGRIRRSNEAARAELMASEEFYRTAYIGLIADVASTYFLLLDLDRRLSISRRTLKSRVDSTRIIRARFNKGYSSKFELHQAQVNEGDAAAAVPFFERNIRQTENALSVLTGFAPYEIKRKHSLTEQPEFPNIPAGLPSELLLRRPDIRAASALLHAQTARIGVAQALRFPQLSLTAAFGVQSTDLSELHFDQDRFWSVGGDLLGPLLSADRNVSRVDAERARTDQLALSYESAVLQALREVEDALIAVKTYRKEYKARADQVSAGKAAVKLTWARYDGGEANYLEVLDTERSLFQNELTESQVLREKLNAHVFLYKALGGGWTQTETQKP